MDDSLRTAGAGGPETTPCKDFGDDILRLILLVRSVATLALAADKRQSRATGQLTELLLEMSLCRAIDAALTYMAGLLRLIYERHPRGAFENSDKINVNDALQFASIDELTQALIEQKVQSLSYRSLSDLADYLERRLKISIFFDSEQRNRATLLVDYRNLIVHNGGIVNRVFKKRHPEASAKIGDHLALNVDTIIGGLRFLIAWIMDLDIRLVEKFGLPTQPRIPAPDEELPTL